MSASKAAVEGFAGGVGSLIALVTTYPLKTIYTLQAIRAVKQQNANASKEEVRQVTRNPYRLIAALCSSLQQSDITALYAGLKPAAVETVASSAIYFYFYSLLRQSVVAYNRKQRGNTASTASARTEDIGVVASLCVAALAGAGNQLITTPAQVMTTQMQAQSKHKQQLQQAGQPADHVQTGTWAVAKQIYEEGGVLGFWKGGLRLHNSNSRVRHGVDRPYRWQWTWPVPSKLPVCFCHVLFGSSYMHIGTCNELT